MRNVHSLPKDRVSMRVCISLIKKDKIFYIYNDNSSFF